MGKKKKGDQGEGLLEDPLDVAEREERLLDDAAKSMVIKNPLLGTGDVWTEKKLQGLVSAPLPHAASLIRAPAAIDGAECTHCGGAQDAIAEMESGEPQDGDEDGEMVAVRCRTPTQSQPACCAHCT